MRAAEAAWFAAGNDSFALMQRAAEAVADRVRLLVPAGGSILVLAGPGNNGGDGYLAASMLAGRGLLVHVWPLRSPGLRNSGTGDFGAGDAGRAAEGWKGSTGPADPKAFDLIIDALFGIGLARPLNGAAADMVAAANGAKVPILSIDIASGIDADSGAASGPVIRATETVTFHTAKPGHLLLPGRLHTGFLTVADIGLPQPADASLFWNGPGLWRLPRPEADTHKYRRGAALVWSGPPLATGASRLAAHAALRAGAGAVTLAGRREALLVQAAHVTAVMLAEADDAQDFARLAAGPKVKAVCVGPAAGAQARCVAGAALQSGKPLVLDADALTAFAGDAAHLARLIRRHPRPVVLTPHAGEFARLFGDSGGSRLESACAAAAASGAVVLLKGADSIIAAPDGRAAVNANAPPWLATAGAGDVLAGLVTGLLAQGMPGFEAAAAAAHLHGAAGELLGAGLTADDLAGPVLGQAIAALS